MDGVGALAKQPQNLDDWVELLQVEEMPIFSNTAQQIYRAMEDEKKGALELGAIILQDPSLTAKLLKVGNSPYYNPARQKISTISRAIVILGMEMIRELTLACSFFESILSCADKAKANQEIALAIHAAVQARELAITLRDQSPEEVFVAALLHNIGHVAFWCSSHQQAVKIHQQLTASQLETKEAEKQILGFTLADLGKKLSKSWHLGGLIEEAIRHPDSPDKRIQNVRLGSRICQGLAEGWESETLKVCLLDIQKISGESLETIKTKIKANTARAVDIARQFGAHDASQFIGQEIDASPLEVWDEEQPDKKQIQFQVLQDITSHISGHINLNVLFEMVMEGIHRGVEMDRTLFMLLGPDKKSLNEKISLGWQKPDAQSKIQIHVSNGKADLFFHALHEHNGMWSNPAQHADLYTAQIKSWFGQHECFLFAIQVEGKPIGLIYCDRGLKHQALTQEDYLVVKHFAKQAEIGLTLYRMKNH